MHHPTGAADIHPCGSITGSAVVTKVAYLLKKPGVVQIPSGVACMSTAVWGPNAHLFDARRFI